MLSDEGCPVKLFKHLQFRNEILLDWNHTRNAINWKRQPNYDISCLIVSLDLFESENNFTFGDDKQAAIIFLVHSEQQVELGWGALGAGRV